jgi:hypothetical protein
MGTRKLTNFELHCLKGLERMYIASEHLFSASYKNKKGIMVNLRNRNQEYMYSMNTLMGLHKAQANGGVLFLDVKSDYQHLTAGIAERSGSPECILATVWTGSCLCMEVPAGLMSIFRRILEGAVGALHLTAQGLAWAIAACTEIGGEYLDKADELIQIANKRYIYPQNALVRHVPVGFRRDWASFAASCYMAYAFLLFGRKTESDKAKGVGLRIARALVSLQGPQGQWAWFYHIPSGKVADYYPVYSVHQHSMAPFFLLEAIDHGYAEFREPLLKGFRWVLGRNEVEQSMVDRTHRVIWRSVSRRKVSAKLTRFARAIGSSTLGLNYRTVSSKDLLVNSECRSYELGWGLWAFGGREDFNEILNDASFI